MAYWDSDQYDKSYVDSPYTPLEMGEGGGRVQVFVADVTITTARASGDYCRLFKVPESMRFLEGWIVVTSAATAAGAANFGDSNDNDRYASALALTSTGKVDFDQYDTGAAYKIGTNSGDNEVRLYVSTAVDAEVTLKVFMAFYQ